MKHPWVVRRNEEKQVQITYVDENHNTTIVVGTVNFLDSLIEEINAFKAFDRTKYYGRKTRI